MRTTKKHRWAIGAAAVVLVAASVAVAGAAGKRAPEPLVATGSYRLVRSIHDANWGGGCSQPPGGDCVWTGSAGETVDLSTATGPVDVVVTLTVTYQTSPGDPAAISAGISPAVGGSKVLEPGKDLPLRPNTRATTTTLRWAKDDVPPGIYKIGFQVHAGKGAKAPLSIRATDITIEIEAWESTTTVKAWKTAGTR